MITKPRRRLGQVTALIVCANPECRKVKTIPAWRVTAAGRNFCNQHCYGRYQSIQAAMRPKQLRTDDGTYARRNAACEVCNLPLETHAKCSCCGILCGEKHHAGEAMGGQCEACLVAGPARGRTS